MYMTGSNYVAMTFRTHYIGKADLSQKLACFCLSTAGIKSIYHHAQHTVYFLTCTFQCKIRRYKNSMQYDS